MLRDLSLSHTWRFLLLSFSAPELVQAQQDVLVLKEALVLARFVLGDKVDLSLFALSIPLSLSLSLSLFVVFILWITDPCHASRLSIYQGNHSADLTHVKAFSHI